MKERNPLLGSPPRPPPHSLLHFGEILVELGGPTWVRGEPVIVESVRDRLPVGLGGQGAESIDSDGRRETRECARASAWRGAGCR